MKLDGAITISHFTGTSEGVTIRIEDRGSRIGFVEVTLTHEDFGKAIGSIGCTPCELEVRGLDKVGKIHEHKIVTVDRPPGFTKDASFREAIEAACEPFEVDGWKAEVGAALRTRQDGQGINVTFRRYLPMERPE